MTTFAPLGESLRSFSSNGELPLSFSEVRKGDAVADHEEEAHRLAMKKARKHKGESGRSRPDSPSSLSCGRIGAGGGGSYAALLPKRAAEGGTVSPSVAVKQLQGENCDPRKADSTATMKMAASAPSTSTASKQLL